MKKSEDVYKLSRYFIEGKYIHWLFGLIFGEIILFILKDETFLKNSCISIFDYEIKNVYIIMSILIVMFVIWFFVSYANKRIKELNDAYGKYNQMYDKYKKVIYELQNEKSKNESERLYNVTMALDTFEPSKFRLLDKLAKDNHNVHAGITLANFYHSGLFNGSVQIVEKDYDKAYYYYNLVEEYDISGVAAWRIGWMHEKEQIDKHLSQEEQRSFALKYYMISKDKGFVKSYNSIGKFYRNGWGGVQRDLNEAIYWFRLATKNGDTFSILNEAYIHAENPKSFNMAIKCFQDAISQNTPLAYLKFAEFIEKNIELLSTQFDLSYAFDLYCMAITSNNGLVSARAYHRIGNLVDRVPDVINDKKTKVEEIFDKMPENFVVESYKKALEVFEYNIAKNVTLSETDFKVYNQLRLEYSI